MRISRFGILICGGLLLGGCETADQKQARVTPPPQAMAPEVPMTVQNQTTAVAAATPVPAPALDPIDSIVADAEREYRAGQANAISGAPEAASQNYENALKILAGAPPNINSDQRVQAERDRIVSAQNDLDLSAPAEADVAEQKSEPAPIDEANETNLPVDPNLKAKAEAELKTLHSDLPLVMNDYVASYINFYSTRGRGVLERALVRAGRYRGMIQRVFKEVGVPQDLIYLAQAESGFQPLALSRAGARGMWQFIGSRAKGYGMERNHWVDDRQDPEKSTRAAAQHLKDLYNEFGDWYLAMAAYNSGPVNVQQGVQRTGFADFWELYKRNVLPKETKNYVPIILAMAIIAKNPAQYGIDAIQPDPPLAFDTVQIDYPVDLRLVAQCVDAPLDTIRDLNPSLLRVTTPKDESFELKLPAGTRDQYHQAIAAIPADKRLWWRYHKVGDGETLVAIARQYHVPAKSITQVNGLETSDITPQTNLIIPIAAGSHAPGEVERVTYSRRPTRYRVRAGDTVTSVADDFGVPPASLRRWNRIKSDTLRRGRMLVIYHPATAGELASASHKSRKHKSLAASTTSKNNAPKPAPAADATTLVSSSPH